MYKYDYGTLWLLLCLLIIAFILRQVDEEDNKPGKKLGEAISSAETEISSTNCERLTLNNHKSIEVNTPNISLSFDNTSVDADSVEVIVCS